MAKPSFAVARPGEEGPGQAMTVRPSDWSAENIGRAPVRVEVLGRPQGPVVRTIDV